MKHGKKYVDSKKLIDRLKLYELDEAVSLVKQTSKAKFDETICLAVRLGVDPRHADQQVRGALVLPHGTGKAVRVLCFTKDPAKIKEAEEAGADIIGDEETIAKIQGGWLEFDVAVATPDMMGQVGKVARILGPRGMMPNPKSGTVTQDIAKAINEIKAGKVEYRVDRNSIINVPVGKASFEDSALSEHITLLMEAIIKAKPSSAKGTYIKSATISSTMGPGIKISQHAFS